MSNVYTGRESALPKVIPERIREAREGKGLSTEGFAEAIGVTRQAVSQFEIGQSGPSAQTMTQIIAVTGQPPTFFTSPRRRKADTNTTPFWRSLKRMDHAARVRILRRLEWAADIVDYVESFIDLPHVDVPDFSWNSDSGNDEDIEHLALRVRQEWSLGNGPIHDMVPLLENHGFILIREPVGCDDMDAVCRWQTGRPFILYSSEVKSNPRTNYNLAHELGHILIHGGIEVDSENIAKVERQANRFAGAFLLPRNSFPLEVLSTSIEYFKTLKSRWRVAISAMIYRCKDLEILNASQVGYLWRQMNALGIKKVEPLDSAFPVPPPSLLSASLAMLVKNRVQTREEIEVAINLNPSDIESLGGTESGWLSAEKVVNFRPKLILRQAE